MNVEAILAEMWRSKTPRRTELLNELLAADPEEVAPDVLRNAYRLKGSEDEIYYPPSSQMLEAMVPLHPDILVKMLKHPDYEVRAGAAYEMEWHYEGLSIGALVQALRADPHPEVQFCALETLYDTAGFGDLTETDRSDSVDALVSTLVHKEERFRSTAAAALGNWRDPALATFLTEALDDPSIDVRHSTIDALGKTGNPESIPLLIRRLKGGYDLYIQSALIEALGALKAVESVPYLIDLLSDTRVPQHKYYFGGRRICDLACVALERIATPEALAAAGEMRRGQKAKQAREESIYLAIFAPIILIANLHDWIRRLFQNPRQRGS